MTRKKTICRNTTCGPQRLTVKHCLEECLQWNYDLLSNMKCLLEKSYKVRNEMMFLNDIRFKEICKFHRENSGETVVYRFK